MIHFVPADDTIGYQAKLTVLYMSYILYLIQYQPLLAELSRESDLLFFIGSSHVPVSSHLIKLQ